MQIESDSTFIKTLKSCDKKLNVLQFEPICPIRFLPFFIMIKGFLNGSLIWKHPWNLNPRVRTQWCFPVFMQVRELSVFIFKLDKKTKIENENGKTVQSEPSCSISDILQSAVYWFCPFYTLQLSGLVRGFNSISQNRKNIFFIVFRQSECS